jgi:hypothetical protein
MKVPAILLVALSFLTSTQATFVDQVIQLQLIDSTTNKNVKNLVTGDVIETTSPAYNLNIIVNGTSTKSVVVAYGTENNRINVENWAPWALCSNQGPIFPACDRLGYGTHTIFLTPYERRSARGARGPTTSLTFTIEKPDYDVTLNLDGVPAVDHIAFKRAAARLEKFVTGDLPDVDSSALRSLNDIFPGYPNTCAYPKVIDDFFYCVAYLTNATYPTTILGNASAFFTPVFTRSDSGLPSVAVLFVSFEQIDIFKSFLDFDALIMQSFANVMGRLQQTPQLFLVAPTVTHTRTCTLDFPSGRFLTLATTRCGRRQLHLRWCSSEARVQGHFGMRLSPNCS